jgi:hypothetical protein
VLTHGKNSAHGFVGGCIARSSFRHSQGQEPPQTEGDIRCA